MWNMFYDIYCRGMSQHELLCQMGRNKLKNFAVSKCPAARLDLKWTKCPAVSDCSQFSSSYALGKLFASRNRLCPRTNILAYFRAKWRLLFIYRIVSCRIHVTGCRCCSMAAVIFVAKCLFLPAYLNMQAPQGNFTTTVHSTNLGANGVNYGQLKVEI